MPSSHRKKRSALFEKSPKILGEVTVYDFANSSFPKGCGRIKKAVTNDLMIAQKIAQEEKEPLESVVDEAETKVVGRRRRRRKSSGREDDVESRPGKIYPLDLWYLISDYIRPQDVLNFSLLCKGSHHVVNTSKFWIGMYKRYCRRDCVIKKLGWECVQRRRGLKAAVVQALFLSCPSLCTSPPIHDVKSVSGLLCILMWIERTGLSDIEDSVTMSSPKNWIYKFKLSKRQFGPPRLSSHDKKLKQTDDINANPDDGCKILTVPCWEYTAVPCVSGMRLCEVKSSSRQVSLVFSSSPLNTSTSQMGNIFIRLQPSQGPTVFDWWHPSYHTSSKSIL